MINKIYIKTVISSTGNDIASKFDQRFGRAKWFCLLDENTGNFEFIKNEYENAQGGAGTKAAEKMAELNVTKVVSGDFGPKAKDLLDKLNIQMVIMPDENNTIQDIIEKIKTDMPHLDKTGPMGKGPKTGRKLGLGTDYDDNEFLKRLGRGLGLRKKSGGGTGKGRRLKSNTVNPPS